MLREKNVWLESKPNNKDEINLQQQEQHELDKNYARQLIEADKGEAVAKNLDKFSGLDHKEIAHKLIKIGDGWEVADNLDKFSGLDHKKIAHKLIKIGEGGAVAKNLDKFSGLDREIALKFIDSRQGDAVADNLDKFSGLDHKEIALKLFEAGNGWAVAHNLDKFSGLDHIDIAFKLFEAGDGRAVANNLEKFSGLDHKEIAHKLIDAGNGEAVANHLDKFSGLDHQEIALKLIETGDGRAVVKNLEKFSGLDHTEIALKLFEAGDGWAVAANLEKFSGLDHTEIALKLFEAGDGWAVAANLEKFSGLDHKEIAQQLIETHQGEAVADNLEKFSGLDHKEIALKLIEAHKGEAVANNLKKFSGLDHKEIALKLIEAHEGRSVANNLDKFSGLDKEIALKLIEAGDSRSVAYNLEKFSGLDHKEIALKLIESQYGGAVADNLDNFSGLDHKEIAHKLIETHQGEAVANNLDNFSGLDHKEIALKLIESQYGGAVAKNLDKFSGLDHKEIAHKLIDSGFANVVSNNLEKFQLSPQEFCSCIQQSFPELWERLAANWPPLAKTVVNFPELLSELFQNKGKKLLEMEKSINDNPFLLKALEDNPRYGSRLALKYHQFDNIAKTEIKTLFEAEADILSKHPSLDKESPEFRQLMQERLASLSNNPQIVEELKKRGINVDQWLNYDRTIDFTLGSAEDIKLSEKVTVPLTRIKEVLSRYQESLTTILAEYKPELQQASTPNPEIETVQENIDSLQAQLEHETDETKRQGIRKGLANLEAKAQNLKPTISIWSKIQSMVFRSQSMIDNIFRLHDVCAAYEANLATITDRPSLIKEKDKLQKNTAQLQKSFADFVFFFDTYEAKLRELIAPVLTPDRTDALLQANNEVLGEDLQHYNIDRETILDIFNKDKGGDDTKLNGRDMKVTVASRSTEDLYLGNYCPCCICIDSSYHGATSPIADFVTDLGIQNIVVYDEKKHIPTVVCWTFIGEDSENGEPIMVIDNIEANTKYTTEYGNTISEALKKFITDYAQTINVQRIVQGPHNNDLEIFPLREVKRKLGGIYNRGTGYYLEAEKD